MNFKDKINGDNLVVVDIETSGLHYDGDNPAEIIEISAIKFKDEQEAERYHSYIKNKTPLSKEISALTEITDEMLSDAPDISTVMNEFCAFAKEALVAAYNAPFDYGFLKKYAGKCGCTLPDSDKWIDVLGIAKQKIKDGVKSYKLKDVAKYFNILYPDNGGTEEYVLATADVLFALSKI